MLSHAVMALVAAASAGLARSPEQAEAPESSMVQIVENWADIEGSIRGSRPSEEIAEHTVVEIEVDGASAVESFPNLMEEHVGKTVEVLVRESALTHVDVKPGLEVSCRVRRAGPNRIYAHPERFETRAPK